MTSSPLLRMDEAADRLRYDGPRGNENALRFLRQHGATLHKRGRRWLIYEAELDRVIAKTRRNPDQQAHAFVYPRKVSA